MATSRRQLRESPFFIPFINERDGLGRLIESEKIPLLPLDDNPKLLDVSDVQEPKTTRRRKKETSYISQQKNFEPIRLDSRDFERSKAEALNMVEVLSKNSVIEAKSLNPRSMSELDEKSWRTRKLVLPQESNMVNNSSVLSSMVPDSESRCRWQDWNVMQYGTIKDQSREPSRKDLPKLGPRYLVLAKTNRSKIHQSESGTNIHSCTIL